MLAFSPRPLSAEFPLAAAAACGAGVSSLGVWLPSRRPLTVAVARGGPRGGRLMLLIDGDLGRLLRRCAAVVVRLGPAIAVVPADELLRARALCVVVPLAQRSAEEVLAMCTAAGAPVLSSRVVYRVSVADTEWSFRRPSAVDSPPGAGVG